MLHPFQIVDIWKDKPVLILGGGSSILKFNRIFLQDFKSIGVNNAGLDFQTDALWYSDDRWFEWNINELQEYKGIIAGCPHYSNPSTVYHYGRQKPTGIEVRKKDCIAWNGNSGGGAINFAYHLGCRVVGLVGFDLKPGVNGERTYHNKHKVNSKRYNPFPLMKQTFGAIAEEARDLNLEIYNLNLDSELEVFPKMPVVDFVAKYFLKED